MKVTVAIPFPDVDLLNPFGVSALSAYAKKVKEIPNEIETLFESSVKEVMTKKKRLTMLPEGSISRAAWIMHKNDFTMIPVVDGVGGW